jgi:hypothetical protein
MKRASLKFVHPQLGCSLLMQLAIDLIQCFLFSSYLHFFFKNLISMIVFLNNVRRIGCVNIVFAPLALSIFPFSPSSVYRTPHLQICKQLAFLFLCVFWGISPSWRTLGAYYAGGVMPNFYVLKIPRKYLFSTKHERKKETKKIVVYRRGGFLYSCILLGTPLSSCP